LKRCVLAWRAQALADARRRRALLLQLRRAGRRRLAWGFRGLAVRCAGRRALACAALASALRACVCTRMRGAWARLRCVPGAWMLGTT
jgi:hypothetical protein